MHIIRIGGDLPADIATLAPFATAEGIGIVDTLLAEWASGANRFTDPGEILLAARLNERLAGIGGLTRDPHIPAALRMRRFYIHSEFRSQGVARQLAEQLIAHAGSYTSRLTCHAGTEAGVRFWERMGFAPVTSETHSHELQL